MKTSLKQFHWLPRIISIVAILFVSVFAADAFSPQLTLSQQLGDFFMHLIPSFVLLTFLVVAWKRELIGGLLFVITGVVLSPYLFLMNYNNNHSIGISLSIILMITFPFIISGALFMMSYFQKKKENKLSH